MKAMYFALALSVAIGATQVPHNFAQEVINLPEDGGLWHTTLVLPSDQASDQASRRLIEHFANSPRLKKLASQTSLHRYTPSDPLFEARYAPYFGGVMPALLIQTADGTVVYKISGDAIPESAEEFANEIAQAIDQCCPLRPKPSPSPSPDQTVTPRFPSINVEVVPDIRPQVEEPAQEPTKSPAQTPLSPLILLAPIVAGALGLRRTPRSI